MLSEKRLIISIFGPDGVGKSTISNQFRKLGFEVFSGTGVASWPDKSWHEKLLAQGIDDTKETRDSHFKEKILRAHELARTLKSNKGVVIDSDPLHKTLMHDYLRTQDFHFLERRFDELSKAARLTESRPRIHLLLKIDEKLEDIESARILQERISLRGERAPFDPETIEQSLKMIKANDLIAELLRGNGQRVVLLSTRFPIDDNELLRLLEF